LAEERRLFYVGLTRARDILILVSSRSRTIAGRKVPSRPSPFLLEIPPECLEKKVWTGKAQGKQDDDEGKYKQLSLF
jgi:superfamily I DNA/RNA helicase